MTAKVLLVEDDPTTRAFLYAATQALGVEIGLAASMHGALALADSTVYSALLLDVSLPDGSGMELLERVRRRNPSIPALAHTAATTADELQRLRHAGFDAAVRKPVSAADWQAAVQSLLAQRAPESDPPAIIPLWDDEAALTILGSTLDDLRTLRDLFVTELPGQIHALEQARTGTEVATIEAQLHRLRASCRFVGAARLTAALAAWTGETDQLDHIIHSARETLAHVA